MGGKKPILEMNKPIWWHNHGYKMKLQKFTMGDNGNWFVIESSAAKLFISGSRNSWLIDWVIVHSAAKVEGTTSMLLQELAAAFGLEDYISPDGEGLIERFGGSAAAQGKFIRYDEYLNIPCPGTAHDGDPNISIKITQEMKDAIIELVSAEKARINVRQPELAAATT